MSEDAGIEPRRIQRSLASKPCRSKTLNDYIVRFFFWSCETPFCCESTNPITTVAFSEKSFLFIRAVDSDPAFQVNPDPRFWWQKTEKKNTAEIFFITFFYKNCYLLLYKLQATGEAFSPQKRTSSSSKKKFVIFFYFCGSFLPGSGSGLWIRIRIRTQGPHWIRIKIRIHSTSFYL